mmetsp:Transcript_2064/g.7645  ORF Transcript_2064/g.7645 Transcript_2064/m.7645 type:complete len:424 (-) Transcript_2064:521-1792(-)
MSFPCTWCWFDVDGSRDVDHGRTTTGRESCAGGARIKTMADDVVEEGEGPAFVAEGEGVVVADLCDDVANDEAHEGAEASDDASTVLQVHRGAVYAVAWSACGRRVACGGGDDAAHVAGAPTAVQVAALHAHRDSVSALSFAMDGRSLATGGLDGYVCVWDVSTSQKQWQWDGPSDGVEWVDWHPRGNVVLAGAEDGSTWMWDASKGRLMNSFHGHGGSVTCGRFTPDGTHVVTASADASLKVWDPKTGTCLHTLHRNPFHDQAINAIHISQDSTVAITGAVDGSVRLANIQTGRVLGKLEGHTDSVETVGFSNKLPLCATGGLDHKLCIWDLHTLTLRGSKEHPDSVIKLLWHPKEPLVYTACADGNVRLWDARTMECIQMFRGHSDAILDMALSPDGEWIITGSDDCTARIFCRSRSGMDT